MTWASKPTETAEAELISDRAHLVVISCWVRASRMGCGSVMGLSQHLEHVVKWSWAGPEVESCWAGLGGVRPGWYSGAALAGRDLG